MRSKRSGVGSPSSTYSVPAWRSAIPSTRLPPRPWLHGSQSTSTGGWSSRNGHACATPCSIAPIMPCVTTTPFVSPRRSGHEQDLRDGLGVDARGGAARRRRVREQPRVVERAHPGRRFAHGHVRRLGQRPRAPHRHTPRRRARTRRPGRAASAIARSRANPSRCGNPVCADTGTTGTPARSAPNVTIA